MSYRVVVVGAKRPDRIVAPCYFMTRQEAVEFGKLSAKVLDWYILVDRWWIEEIAKAPNCVYQDGKILPLSPHQC